MHYHINPYESNHEFQRQIDPTLRRDIQKAINDQFKAISWYTQLAELAPDQNAKQAILGIRQDEIRHFNAFSQSYLNLTNRYPRLNLVNQKDLPVNYRQGVRESIKDERETVPFYLSIANRLTDPRAKRRFTRAAYDEQRHAEILRNL
ncbi:ferritin-like domain-containing protein [Rossellomorea aquimaris]|uniref:ferritin family protein n=1 Tax=Rossellomorea aquimaris TaxID=189382 RepID=UPI001CD6C3EF|nr:ferritin-like domain-containing protein [Rossellomorea aquimaris]MCA1053938.1 ferritin-like domain-containing protein [Rossellomorea aquimaris]